MAGRHKRLERPTSFSKDLEDVQNELYDMIDAALEAGYVGVWHKLEEALGKLSSAEDAARQYESGERNPAWPY